MTGTLVTLRHGESEWNKLNLFTGWHDVSLTEQGTAEAAEAGRTMAAEGLRFDIAHTSLLTRAVVTNHLALDAMGMVWLPLVRHWRLNERHYGALQGLNKADMARQYGDEQVLRWRRSYDVPPPVLAADDPRGQRGDLRYAALEPAQVPLTECLKDTVARVLPCWRERLAPAIAGGRRLLVAAHGNSIRALVKMLDEVSDDDIVGINIPNGVPLVYELDARLRPLGHRYLGDADAVARAAAAVASQGRA